MFPVTSTYQHAVLRCGGQAYWLDMPNSQQTQLGVIVKIGSRSDPPEVKGLAHMVEHMCFQGSASFLDALQLVAPIESIGGSFDGETVENASCFSVLLPPTAVKIGWTFLEQAVFHSLMRARDFRRMVVDIKNEIAEDQGTFPHESHTRLIETQLFGKELVRQANIIGTHRTLNTMTPALVRRWYRRHYVPTKMVFVAIGNISSLGCSWPAWLEHKLLGLPDGTPWTWPATELSARVHPGAWEEPVDGIVRPHVSINCRIHEVQDGADNHGLIRRDVTAELIDGMLVKGWNSALQRELRIRRNLVYALDSELLMNAQTALRWQLNAVLKNQADVRRYLRSAKKIVADPLTWSDGHVAVAKQKMLGQILLDGSSTEQLFEDVTEAIYSGQPLMTPNERLNIIESITGGEVRRMVASDFLPEWWVTMTYLPA